MGNNNAYKTKYNDEKEVKLDISLNKVCYLPGEQIIGNLDIQPKNGISETILNFLSFIYEFRLKMFILLETHGK